MDAAPHVEVRVRQRFSARAERVFESWLDPGIAGRWLFATAWRPMASVTIDARAGGAFLLAEQLDGKGAVHTGRYVEIVRPRRLVFALSGGKHSRGARVRVEITPMGAGCELTVVQESVLPGDAISTEGRWTGMLYGLATLLGE